MTFLPFKIYTWWKTHHHHHHQGIFEPFPVRDIVWMKLNQHMDFLQIFFVFLLGWFMRTDWAVIDGDFVKALIPLQWRIQDFPEGGAPTPKSANIFQFFSRKLHANERIWTSGGHVPGAPLESANAVPVQSVFPTGSYRQRCTQLYPKCNTG